LVYCTVCGEKNEEDAKICSNCGTPLYSKGKYSKGNDCFGPREEWEAECFGVPYGSVIVGAFFGMLLIIVGVLWLFSKEIAWIWSAIAPLTVILLGILIVVGVLFRLSHR